MTGKIHINPFNILSVKGRMQYLHVTSNYKSVFISGYETKQE